MFLEFYLFCMLGGAAIGCVLYVSVYCCSDTNLCLPLSSSASYTSNSREHNSYRHIGGDCYCESAIKRAAYNTSLYYKISRDVRLVLVRLAWSTTAAADGSSWRAGSLIAVGVWDATRCLAHDVCTVAWPLAKSCLSIIMRARAAAGLMSFDGVHNNQWVASPIFAVMILAILVPVKCVKLVFVRGAQQFCELLELLDGDYTAMPPTHHHHHHHSLSPTQQQFGRLDGSHRMGASPATAFTYTGRYVPSDEHSRRDAAMLASSVQSGFSPSKSLESMNTGVTRTSIF
ncbi:hypothetical protein V1525DRAFT_397539 [Lipomyces kononenkoae]|uniref:Uncharacterized protein n=1 Tax=Lipomyces kononenkoae TaxID=34357 RepID=A0ACC3T6Y7_LIPKO